MDVDPIRESTFFAEAIQWFLNQLNFWINILFQIIYFFLVSSCVIILIIYSESVIIPYLFSSITASEKAKTWSQMTELTNYICIKSDEMKMGWYEKEKKKTVYPGDEN